MDRGDFERIVHIGRYCEAVAKTIRRFGVSFEVFIADPDYYNSISMSVLQIGELANGLSDKFKTATRAEVPWNLIRGMRNHFAHGMKKWIKRKYGKLLRVTFRVSFAFANAL